MFLEEDSDGPGLLAALTTRPDLPPPSYVLHSSPGRLHVLWRTRHFERDDVEALQKRLARELDTDPAATSCAQTTRLPGFVNHKHERPWLVRVEYLPSGNRARARRLSRSDAAALPARRVVVVHDASRPKRASTIAWTALADFSGRSSPRSLASMEIFGRSESVAASCGASTSPTTRPSQCFSEWNARCEPPWSERELLEKVQNARRYGREPFGGLLGREFASLTHAYARMTYCY